MPMETVAGPFGEVRAISSGGGGTALSTTRAYIQIPKNTQHVWLTARNFNTGVVAKVHFNPYLVVLKTTDDLATVTNYSDEAQDNDTGTSVVLSSLGALSDGDYVLVGSHIPFGGVYVDVDGANSNDSVLTVHYWNGTAWTDISATDGTASSGKSLAADGVITWTVPSAWVPNTLVKIHLPNSVGSAVPYRNEHLYWTRFSFSAALDSAVTLDAVLALNRSSVPMELIASQSFEMQCFHGFGGFGCIEATMNDGTGNLVVNAGTGKQGMFN